MTRTGEIDPKMWPEIRGLVLRYIYRRDRKHEPVVFERIWRFVFAEGYRITLQDLDTVLSDLAQEELIARVRKTNPETGVTRTTSIRMLAKGRDLIEETAKDPSIKISIARAHLETEEE